MSSLVNNSLGGDNSNRANAAFMVGLFTILGALSFEYLGGFQPCELCYAQRTPYYIGLPILAALMIFWRTVPFIPRIALTLIVAGIFLWSTYLGAFHAGIEWKFWPGPTSCTGAGIGALNFADLGSANQVKVVPCDVPTWHFLGLTFAGYNAIISLVVSGLLFWSALGQLKRRKSTLTKSTPY